MGFGLYVLFWPRLFKSCIALSTGYDKHYEKQLRYPLDSAIHLSKNWGQVSNFLYFYCGYILKHVCGYMVTKSP